VTANPTIVANAIEASDAYDQQFDTLITAGQTVQDACWGPAITDVIDALEILRPSFDASDGSDGFVSIEVPPECPRDTDESITNARFRGRTDAPERPRFKPSEARRICR
jgi:transaldolase